MASFLVFLVEKCVAMVTATTKYNARTASYRGKSIPRYGDRLHNCLAWPARRHSCGAGVRVSGERD